MTRNTRFEYYSLYIQTIHDYQQQAQRHVSEDVWGYLNGGAMHEISVKIIATISKYSVDS